MFTETDSDYDDTDHTVSPTFSSSSWRGRNESGTITARAKTSTYKHESDEDSAVSWSSWTGTEFSSLSSIFETYVKPVLNEDSIESVKRLAEELKNWFREVRKFMTKMAEEL